MFAPRFYTAPHFAAHQQPRHHRQEQQPNFQGLFRMLDDWERYAQQGQSQGRRQCQQQQAQTPSFTPKFDVKETETTYELHGEFPGMDKENVHIEFTDPQTLQIRGHIERSLTTAGTPPAAANLVNNKKNDEGVEMSNGVVLDAPAPAVAATEQQPQHEETDIDEDDEPVVIDSHDHDDAASVTSSNKSFQATVEDEVEEGTTTIATPATTNAEAVPTKPTTTEEKKPVVEKKQTTEPQPQAQTQKPATPAANNTNKYWLRERSIGRFARSFTFTSRVDTEGVSASMHNGVLSVTVPKARKHESYRIAIL